MTLHLKLKLNRVHFSLSLNNQKQGRESIQQVKDIATRQPVCFCAFPLCSEVFRGCASYLETKHLGLKGLEMVGEKKRKLCLESLGQLSINAILDCIIEFFNLV